MTSPKIEEDAINKSEIGNGEMKDTSEWPAMWPVRMAETRIKMGHKTKQGVRTLETASKGNSRLHSCKCKQSTSPTTSPTHTLRKERNYLSRAFPAL